MKVFRTLAAVVAMIMTCSNMTNAQSIGDLLGKLGGKSGSTETVGNLLEGIFTKSAIEVSDLQGEWLSNGPAVAFQGDNFLKQAGGKAASAAIESKLKPYFTKYGLTGGNLIIDSEGNFQFTFKKMKLKGTITKTNEKGVFYFNFNGIGKMGLGKVKAYVQKTSRTMDVMFDATKLISIIGVVANVSNISTLKTLSSLLTSYDGLCVGFSLEYKGAATSLTNTTTTAKSGGSDSLLNNLGKAINSRLKSKSKK